MKKRILVVEDEKHLAETIKLNLEIEDYHPIVVHDGASAISTFKEQRFDLVILDIMIPNIDGIAVCENIRLHDGDVPVMFLSALSSSEDRILGLKKGGDDYLTKPFNLEELMLRIAKLIARKEEGTKTESISEYTFGANSANFDSYEAVGKGGKFSLTKKEALLLKLLIENKDEVVSREKILQTVWGYSVYPSTRTIDNFILAFRKYFEEDPKNPRFFLSLRGVGYKFTNSAV
ncbi:MAG: response regulator transcription factor [Bacteroidetes bacterium]|jgi:two-component system alkaline phosphatase synthesis response regulator PhoP|nr:response regulator transcription factor [Bacteroidota bacterium]MDA8930337.1 response regulator transcription factor [Bacteroidia bacterium]